MARLWEHAIFQDPIKVSTYVSRHQLENKGQVAREMLDFIERYRGQGNCTAACAKPVEKETAMELAHLGEPAALTWCKFAGWLPLSFQPGPEHVRETLPAGQSVDLCPLFSASMSAHFLLGASG